MGHNHPMQKIKILYLYSSKGFGGMVHNISLLANHLNKENFEVLAIALTNSGDKDSELELNKDSSVIFRRIDEKGKFNLSSINQIDRLIKEFNVDILSCHGYKADIYGFILRKFYHADPKLVTVAHGWVTPGIKMRFYYFLDKLVMKSFDRIVLVSKALQREIKGFLIPRERIVCIDNAIDPDDFVKKCDNSAVRGKLNINDEDYVMTFAGRLSKEKNIGTILLAVRELISAGKKVRLLVAGDGPLRDRLVESAKKLDIEENVIFAGYQKNINEIYSISDVYISASFKEGLSNSLLEAQAIGIPCIASDIAGNDEIIKDGVNGSLFKPKDHKGLAKKISALMEDKDLAGRFIMAGQKMIKEKFSMQERILKFEKLYQNLISN